MRKRRQYGWKQAPDTLLSFKTLEKKERWFTRAVQGREFQIIASTAFLTR